MSLQPTMLLDGSVPAAIPANDHARIAQLHEFCILDTGKDPRFDRITQLTADLLCVPIVLVSLVAEAREWFKSAVGTEIAEIKRDHGFCAHALLADGTAPVTVPDVLDDPRFAMHPFVVSGPMLRFYSGAPLVTATGHKLGMLCVHDFKPRPDFGQDEERVLGRLAAIVMDEIDFHRIETERELLIGELSHRVKNVFSTIASVANMSGRGDPSAAPYIEAFNGRLVAMEAAHNQLLKSSWKSARLIEIVQSVVAPYQNSNHRRIILDLPDMAVDPLFAQTLALFVHELLTNSIKYGALKVATGCVTITALRAVLNNGRSVKFEWRETGGPSPIPPRHKGFGHQMLLMAVKQKGGFVQFDWQTQGLVCEIEIPEDSFGGL